MGKRKERRLTAKMGAGRRVKLDLFIEPPGDFGGSLIEDEVGKDMEARVDAELSNSPSSSGQNEENPLSLLGQYSDDELDQESNQSGNEQKDTLVSEDDQTKVSVSKPSEGGEAGDGNGLSLQKAENCDLETNSSLSDASPIVEAAADEKPHEANKEKAVPSDTQTAEGASSCWKMVLHEDSNLYYYWNTVTGETSWEVPDGFSQATGAVNGHSRIEMKESDSGDLNATGFSVKSDESSALHSLAYPNGVADVAGVCEHGLHVNQSLEQSKSDEAQLLGTSCEVGTLPCGTATMVNYSQYNQVNTSSDASAIGYDGHGGYSSITEHVTVDTSQLINRGEALLDRLKSLQWCGFDSDEHRWVSKYISEVEIRLSDIRTLIPHGVSLLPFWRHSDRQLNDVENGINTEIERQKNKISAMHLNSAERDNEKADDRKGVSKVNEDMIKLSPENSIINAIGTSVPAEKELPQKISNIEILNEKHVSVNGHPTHLHVVSGGGQEIDVNSEGKESIKSGFQSGEDVDMDIDMEIEDLSSARNLTTELGCPKASPSKNLAQPSASVVDESLGNGSEFIPPPPDEEWVPPPPPDNEGIPPPPPDEPPESLCPPPPAELKSMQFIHSDQYYMTYAESNVNYYGNLATGSSFYDPADGSQMPILNAPAYYASTSNEQAATIPVPVSSVVYYGLQTVGMPVVPVDSTMGSSGIQSTSSLVNCSSLSSNQIATIDASAGASLLSNQFMEPLVSGPKTDAASIEPSTSVVLATTSMKECVSVPSFSTSVPSCSISTTSAPFSSSTFTATDTSTAITKAQPKVVRTKKPKVAVASSLRSNRKVSSLVDKWKAAKEELEEEEEQVRESPLELLEKKRQREIEEWRAQQIASGEAKENANFQPLGGDWRERVKRRRAKKEAAAEKLLVINNESKQPDLDELSKDLPSAWQAYWDDSSKQVYYANSITSETTWTKPMRENV